MNIRKAATFVFVTVLAVVMVGCSPSKTEDVAEKIARFSIPAGYEAEFGVSLDGYDIASYSRGDGHSHLYLIQAPDSVVTQEELEEKLNQAPSYSRSNRQVVIEKRMLTVRGQEVTALIHEGTNSEGGTYRQITVGFQGKNGAALLSMEEPVSSWNLDEVIKFVESLQ
ncbi:MAG: hypothetical protein HGA86_07425 [Anaerolineaceae bacterium]|nr:hypothetical protein [Anaerolineaceae bacterium]